MPDAAHTAEFDAAAAGAVVKVRSSRCGRGRATPSIIAALLVTAAGVTFANGAQAAPAPSPGHSGRVAVDNSRWDNPAGFPPPICGFTVTSRLVASKEFSDTTTAADGTTNERVTGKLIIEFTNPANHRSLRVNASGPFTEIDHPDGRSEFFGEGRSINVFGPRSQAATSQPGIVLSTGRTVLISSPDSDGVLVHRSFSATGKVINVCGLLA